MTKKAIKVVYRQSFWYWLRLWATHSLRSELTIGPLRENLWPALNAGVALIEWEVSPNGFEQTLQVNVVSTALLAVHSSPIVFDCG
jgi:hypothetical protein